MTQRIDRAEILHLATLARLELSEDEIDGYRADLERILDYVATLDQVDTRDLEPTTHAVELPVRLREDVARPGLPVEEGLANAPERLGDGFGVPRVIE